MSLELEGLCLLPYDLNFTSSVSVGVAVIIFYL